MSSWRRLITVLALALAPLPVLLPALLSSPHAADAINVAASVVEYVTLPAPASSCVWCDPAGRPVSRRAETG